MEGADIALRGAHYCAGLYFAGDKSSRVVAQANNYFKSQ